MKTSNQKVEKANTSRLTHRIGIVLLASVILVLPISLQHAQ
ncbi:MAG TPA: hypothetical protein VLM38_21670 [Blastocatellia bacterium]|nr:hypothetical protein [Blastocatellia bacterium]